MAQSLEDFQKLREGGNKMTRFLLLLLVAAIAVWWQFIRLPQQVEIANMVPGLDGGMTRLECWLTLEFKELPAGDPLDLQVVFEGEAIQGGEQRFRWAYIAANDMTAVGKRMNNDATTAYEAPPVGKLTKINFPLKAKERVEEASFNMPLVATVYWGGKKQDKLQRSVGHAYRHEGSAL